MNAINYLAETQKELCGNLCNEEKLINIYEELVSNDVKSIASKKDELSFKNVTLMPLQ